MSTVEIFGMAFIVLMVGVVVQAVLTRAVVESCLKDHYQKDLHPTLDMILRLTCDNFGLKDSKSHLESLLQKQQEQFKGLPINHKAVTEWMASRERTMMVGDKIVPLTIQPESPRGLKKPLEGAELDAIVNELRSTY